MTTTTRICPQCDDDIPATAKSHKCGWRLANEQIKTQPRQRHMTPEAKALYEAYGPRPTDLTAQQWYDVCRFWPMAARHCQSRPLADVGPHNPLHATSVQRFAAPRIRERQPGEDDE